VETEKAKSKKRICSVKLQLLPLFPISKQSGEWVVRPEEEKEGYGLYGISLLMGPVRLPPQKKTKIGELEGALYSFWPGAPRTLATPPT